MILNTRLLIIMESFYFQASSSLSEISELILHTEDLNLYISLETVCCFCMITLVEPDSSDMFTHTHTSSKASYLRLKSVTADSLTRSTSVLGFLMKGRYLSSLPSRRLLSLCFSAFGLAAVQIFTVTLE